MRVALATLALIFVYGVFVNLVRPHLIISYDSGLRNRIVAEQYVDGPTKRVVLTGSSLAVRLAPDVIGDSDLGQDVFDLAMLGQNSATGLDVILHSFGKPKLVLVEMNVLEHSYNPDFAGEILQEPWRFLRRTFSLFRLENRPLDLSVIAIEKAAKLALNSVGVHSAETVYAPPSDDTIARASPPVFDPADPANKTFLKNVNIALARLGDQIDQLRLMGIKVILLRFPVDASFGASQRELYKRERAYERFPAKSYQWYDLQDTGAYQTLDGSHLTMNSARVLASVIRRIISENEK